MNSTYIGTSGRDYFQSRHKSRDCLAQAESAKIFAPYVSPEMTVVDFGCGTGRILANLDCRQRIGIEINEPSIIEARGLGLDIVSSPAELPEDSADLIISHHALEHVPEPFATLTALHRILKPGGQIVIVVPSEKPHRSWHPDPNRHLYSWTPLTLGNLLQAAGFRSVEGLRRPAGYSHYLETLRGVPFLLSFACGIVARVLHRFNTQCRASK